LRRATGGLATPELLDQHAENVTVVDKALVVVPHVRHTEILAADVDTALGALPAPSDTGSPIAGVGRAGPGCITTVPGSPGPAGRAGGGGGGFLPARPPGGGGAAAGGWWGVWGGPPPPPPRGGGPPGTPRPPPPPPLPPTAPAPPVPELPPCPPTAPLPAVA